MTKAQNVQTKITRTVLTTLDAHSALWAGVPGIVESVAELDALGPTVDLLLRKQTTPTEGATLTKRQARIAVTDQTLAAAGMLIAFAGTVRPELVRKAATTRRALLHRRQEDALIHAERIEQLVADHPEALARYSADPQFAAKLGDTIDDYRESLGKKRRLVVARVGATGALEVAFARMETLLRVLDGLVVQFQRTQPVFFQEYQHARIDDTPGTPKVATPVPLAAPVVSEGKLQPLPAAA